jgi:hypothetical protein
MRKILIAMLFAIGIMFCGAFMSTAVANETIEPLNAYSEAPAQAPPAPTANKTPSGTSSAIPLRLCFLPNVWYWPTGLDVYGLNLGLPISYGEGEKMYGWDLALIASMTDGVKGLQTSIINKGYQITGGEIALVNFAQELTGFQLGAVNSQTTSDGVQLGIINMSQKSNGLQIGLINIMDNGFLPLFPFINFSM